MQTVTRDAPAVGHGRPGAPSVATGLAGPLDFRSIAEESPTLILVTDHTGRIEYVNPAFCSVTGYQREDVLGQSIHEFGDIDAETLVELWNTLGFGLPWRGEFAAPIKDGGRIWVHSSISPVKDAVGQVAHFVALNVDLTARKQSEEALRWSAETFRAIVETIPEVVWSTDLDCTVLYVSPAVEAVLGYRPEELIGANARDLLHPDDQMALGDLSADYGAGVNLRSGITVRWLHKDGSWRHAESVVSPLPGPDGRVKGFNWICRDAAGRVPANETQGRSDEGYRVIEEALQALRQDVERRAAQALGKKPYKLSFRELTVLQLVASGRSDKEIGAVLGIRPLTVSKHVANILKKMKVQSRTAAGMRALQDGLIEQPGAAT